MGGVPTTPPTSSRCTRRHSAWSMAVIRRPSGPMKQGTRGCRCQDHGGTRGILGRYPLSPRAGAGGLEASLRQSSPPCVLCGGGLGFAPSPPTSRGVPVPVTEGQASALFLWAISHHRAHQRGGRSSRSASPRQTARRVPRRPPQEVGRGPSGDAPPRLLVIQHGAIIPSQNARCAHDWLAVSSRCSFAGGRTGCIGDM